MGFRDLSQRVLCCLATFFALIATITSALCQTAALVPNASQQFFNAQGQPLAGGQVFFYVPNTTTPKSIWIDPFQNILGANPVQLDSGGFPNTGGSSPGAIFGQGNYQEVVYDANNNLIYNGFTSAYGSPQPSGSSGTDTAPVGTIMPWGGNNGNVPTNWMLAYGETLSRTTYSQLLTALTISTTTGSCTSTSVTVSGYTDTSQIPVGAPIESPCLPTSDTVASIVNSTTITVTAAATATGTFTATVFPWGDGDGVSTFTLPDLRGRVLPGADAMGGAAASRLTSTYYGSNANVPAVAGGSQDQTLGTGNIPQFSFTPTGSVAVSGSNSGSQTVQGFVASGGGGAGSNLNLNNSGATSGSLTIDGSNFSWSGSGSFTGNGIIIGQASPTAIATIQPSITINYIIKVAPNSTGAGGVVSLGGMFGDIVCASTLTCAPVGNPSVNTIGCSTMTSNQLGCAVPDNVTVTVNSGVLSAIAGIASQINVGGTTIGSGTNGYILYDNSGTLGDLATTGSGDVVLATSPTLVTPALGTPSAIVLTNASGLPLNTAVTGTLQPANGGLGTNAASATGVMQFASGTPSITTVLANGTTGITQSVGDTSTDLATDQFVSQVTTLSSLTLSGAQITSGTISAARLPVATNSALGIAECDGVTTTCTSGVVTAVGAAATSVASLTTSISGTFTSGDLLGSTSSGCSALTPCVVDSGVATSNLPTLSGNNTFAGDVYFKSGRPWADVRAFGCGAVNHSNDNTTCLQGAINAVQTLGGGTAYISEGAYCTYSGLTINTSYITLQGETGSILDACGHDITVLTLHTSPGQVQRARVADLQIYGDNSTSATNVVILVNGCVACRFDRVDAAYGYNVIFIENGTVDFFEDGFSFAYGDANILIQNSGGWSIRTSGDDGWVTSAPASPITVNAWAATTAYAANSIVTIGSGAWYIQCTNCNGTLQSGASQPSVATFGTNITDGSLTWQLLDPVIKDSERLDTGTVQWQEWGGDHSGPFRDGIRILNSLSGTNPAFITIDGGTSPVGYDAGINVNQGNSVNIAQDIITSCWQTGCSGVIVGASSGGAINITGNIITDNPTDVSIAGISGVETTVVGNTLTGWSSHGITVSNGASGYVVNDNTFGVGGGGSCSSAINDGGSSPKIVQSVCP